MRQEARIRPQRALVEEEDQPPLEPEHPTGTRDCVRQPQAAQRLHLVHQGRQSNPLTAAAQTSSLRSSGLDDYRDDHRSPSVSVAHPPAHLPPDHLLKPVGIVHAFPEGSLQG
jgi:hypothetical protein